MKETARARQAWADYLVMGPERSLESLVERYRNVRAAGAKVPTCRLPTLCDWSRFFGWQTRLATIADQAAREAEEREAQYRREIMEQGYALAHERVKALKAVAEQLFVELTVEGDDNRRWVRDVKQIGSGEFARTVDIERFNAAEVEQLRGLLDDIAKEKGERKQIQELSGPGGGPIEIDPTAGLSDEQRAARVVELLKRAELRREQGTTPVPAIASPSADVEAAES